MNQDRTNRKLAAIFSTDVVGYSKMMEADEAWTIQNLEENKNLMSSLIEEYKGRVVDSPGDNLLAEFSSVINAVECAVKIQQELNKKNSKLMEDHRMLFRIGVNLGDVVEEDGKVYGNGVNIAARLESLADPGGICISRKVYDEIKTKLDLGYEYLGEHDVKNISDPVMVYRVQAGIVIGGNDANRKVQGGLFRVRNIAVVIIIIIAGLLVWRFYPSGRIKVEPASIVAERPAAPEIKEAPKTIAVLPFEDISPDKDQEYFVDGLTEEILNSLTQIPDLLVTGRTSSFSFKGTSKKVPEIAKELGVGHILEGSVRKAGNSLRITAQLLRGTDGFHLWSETYDRELNVQAMFAVQEEIAAAVADKLKLTIEAFQLLGGTDNIEAYELYLIAKGLKSNWKHPQALEKINEAIALDNKFALAWTLKVAILTELASWNTEYVSSGLLMALETAQEAIEIEPMLGKAFLSLGSVYAAMGKFIEAEKNYKKGLDLGFETKDFMEYGLTTHYGVVGRLRTGYGLIEKVLREDPLNPNACGQYIFCLGCLGDMEEAEKEYKHKKEIFGSNWLAGDIIINGLRLGAKNAITVDYLSKIQLGYAWPIIKANLASPEEGIIELHGLYNGDIYLTSAELTNIALGAAYFDDYDFAMEALEKSARINVSRLWKIWFPVMHDVRKTGRFKIFVRDIGLVDNWKEYGWPDLCHPVGDDDFVCD